MPAELMRCPVIVTVDTGAVKLQQAATVGAECEHEGHESLLVIESVNGLVSVAGTKGELLDFAADICLAVVKYEEQREAQES